MELSAAGFGKGVDTAGIRQRIITKLIEEGRGMVRRVFAAAHTKY